MVTHTALHASGPISSNMPRACQAAKPCAATLPARISQGTATSSSAAKNIGRPSRVASSKDISLDSCIARLLFDGRWRLGQPAGLAQGITQQVFDLRVEAAQVIVGPPLRRRQDVGADAQRIGFLLAHQYSEPVLTTGWVPRSEHNTVSRLPTICALRSSSSTTTPLFCSSDNAISTMPTAPATIRVRAAITALACWRCSIAWAISGA